MNRLKIIFASAIVCAATFVGYNLYKQATMTEEDRLVQANIEALMNVETSTSWSCVGKDKKCKVSCGVCGTSIDSEGTLTGSHTCSM